MNLHNRSSVSCSFLGNSFEYVQLNKIRYKLIFCASYAMFSDVPVTNVTVFFIIIYSLNLTLL